jgi:hypothetical protein
MLSVIKKHSSELQQLVTYALEPVPPTQGRLTYTFESTCFMNEIL